MIGRVRRALARHGVRGTARRLVELGRERVSADEEHIVYELRLEGERPRLELPDGMRVVRAGREQLPLLEEIPSTGAGLARRWFDEGNSLWLVMDGERPAFSCWTFPEALPAAAAKGGRLPLPPGTVALENSVTSAAYRGRGVAPSAWSVLADRLQSEGVERMITQVTVENVASRKAVEKAGYREFARTKRVRRGTRTRVSVAGTGAAAEQLRSAIQR